MNLQTKLKARLKKLDQERAQIETRLKKDSAKKFGALPAQFGLRNIDELMRELAAYASPRVKAALSNGGPSPAAAPKAPPRAKSATPSAPAASGPAKRRGRPPGSKAKNYSDEFKAAVKKDLLAGTKSGAVIAKEHGVSLPTIKNWKRQWGLVKGGAKPGRPKKKK